MKTASKMKTNSKMRTTSKIKTTLKMRMTLKIKTTSTMKTTSTIKTTSKMKVTSKMKTTSNEKKTWFRRLYPARAYTTLVVLVYSWPTSQSHRIGSIKAPNLPKLAILSLLTKLNFLKLIHTLQYPIVHKLGNWKQRIPLLYCDFNYWNPILMIRTCILT